MAEPDEKGNPEVSDADALKASQKEVAGLQKQIEKAAKDTEAITSERDAMRLRLAEVEPQAAKAEKQIAELEDGIAEWQRRAEAAETQLATFVAPPQPTKGVVTANHKGEV